MFNFLRKSKTRYYTENGLLQIIINKKLPKENFKLTILIFGLFYINCDANYQELLKLAEYLDLDKDEYLPNPIPKFYTELKVSEFPLRNLIMLYTRKGENYLSYYNKILKELKKENITNRKEQQEIIINNFQNNKQRFLKYFNSLNSPLERWLFKNSTIFSKTNYFQYIDNLIPFHSSELITQNALKYNQTNNLEELSKLIVPQDICFRKEFNRFLQQNMFVKENKYFINIMLFEKLRLIFLLDKKRQIKSIKKMQIYLDRLNKIEMAPNNPQFVLKDKYNLVEDIVTLCNLFIEDNLQVLLKLNVGYHLIGKFKDVLIRYKDKYKVELSCKKEKRLYYFINELSKRLSKDIPDFDLENPNNGFNNKPFKDFNFKRVDTFNELYKIGVSLNNCAGNYEQIEYYKEHFTFLYKGFLGTIKDGKLTQLKGYKNKQPSFDLFQEVIRYLIDAQYLDVIEDENQLYEKACTHSFID